MKGSVSSTARDGTISSSSGGGGGMTLITERLDGYQKSVCLADCRAGVGSISEENGVRGDTEGSVGGCTEMNVERGDEGCTEMNTGGSAEMEGGSTCIA